MRNPGRGEAGVSSSVDVGGTGLAPSRVGEVTMQVAFCERSQKDAILIPQFNLIIVVLLTIDTQLGFEVLSS